MLAIGAWAQPGSQNDQDSPTLAEVCSDSGTGLRFLSYFKLSVRRCK